MSDLALYGGGASGLSAYEIYVEVATEAGDPILSKSAWLDSLVGPTGVNFDADNLEWASGTLYAATDGVTYSGSVYLAKRATQGEAPAATPDAWQLMIEGIDADLYDDLLSAAEAQRVAAQSAAATATSASTAAAASAAAAAVSANAATVAADVYASTSAGLAGTSVGDQFAVADGDEIVRYRHDSGPVATELVRYPSAAAVAAQQVEIDQKATRYVVPLLAAAVTLVAAGASALIGGTDASGDLAAPVGRAWIVPAFGALRQIEVTPDGAIIGTTGTASPIMTVPRLADLVSAELGEDGSFIAAERAERLPAEVGEIEVRQTGGQVTGRATAQAFLRRTSSVYVPLTCGQDAVEVLSADTGSATVSRNGVASSVKWRATPVGTGGTMHMLLMVGQSLAMGYTDSGISDRWPLMRDPVADRAWQFAAGDGVQRGPRPSQVRPVYANRAVVVDDEQLAKLEPLRGALHAYDEQFSQTVVETAAFALLGHHLHHMDQVLGAVIGTGSTAIADFTSGSAHYQSCTAAITAAAAQAEARNCDLTVWLIWSQGEEDNAVATSQATYEAAWTDLMDDLAAHAVSEGATWGGAVIQQCLQRPGGVTGMATLAHAHLIATGEAAGVPPVPMRPGHSGAAHLFPAAYLPLGAAVAAEIARAIDAGSVQAPPHVSAAVLTTSTQIDCAISGGNGTIVFDTTTMDADPDGTYGVRVINSSGTAVAITSVEIVGGNALRITLPFALTLGSPAPRVEFGLDGPALLSQDDYARVNIRDTSGYRCPATGQVVSGWMIHHRVNITA